MKKVLLFETSRTLTRAFELALRASSWTVVKMSQENRIFALIDVVTPDAVIVERKALSEATKEGLLTLPLPVVFCAADIGNDARERFYLPRPFSGAELFTVLDAAMHYDPAIMDEEEPSPLELGTATVEEDPELDISVDFSDDEPMVETVEMMASESESHAPQKEEIAPVAEPVSLIEKSEEEHEEENAIVMLTPSVGEPEESERPAVITFSEATEPEKEEKKEEVIPSPSTTLIEELFSAPPIEEPPVEEPPTKVPEKATTLSTEETIEETADTFETTPGPNADKGTISSDELRELVRNEIRTLVAEYFWEEAPRLLRQLLEEEIRTYGQKPPV